MRINLNKINSKGFTLIEIMVSFSIFAVVMLFVSSAVFGVFDSNRKSQSLRAVMDNLNLSLESMTRTIRFGKKYHCDITQGTVTAPSDCISSPFSSSVAVLDSSGVTITYRLNGGRIVRTVNGGSDEYITGTDVTITNLAFRVYGSAPYVAGAGNCPIASGNDCFQPQIIIVVSGYSGAKPTSRTTFNLQTTVSQRIFDTQ